MIKDPKLVPIAKNYPNFLAHRETHLKIVSTGVENITIWVEAISCKKSLWPKGWPQLC